MATRPTHPFAEAKFMTLHEYLTLDWGKAFKPQLKRAILEIDCAWAELEAQQDGLAYTPLYWNEVAPGKWLYSLWKIK